MSTLYDARSIASRSRRRLQAMAALLGAPLSPRIVLDLLVELDTLSRDLTALDVCDAKPTPATAASIAADAARRAHAMHALCAGWAASTPDLYAVESMHRHTAALILAATRLHGMVDKGDE